MEQDCNRCMAHTVRYFRHQVPYAIMRHKAYMQPQTMYEVEILQQLAEEW